MKKIEWREILDGIARVVAALVAIGLTTTILRIIPIQLGPQVVALIYLLTVLGSTVWLGLTPGALAAFAAFLAFNYFFIPPYGTLAVHNPVDLFTLVIFLIVAFIMSQLIGQARESSRLARRREWEATRMYELISSVAGQAESKDIARSLAFHVLDTFQARGVEVLVEGRPGEDKWSYRTPDTYAFDGKPAVRIPLMTARALEGEIRLWLDALDFSQEEQRLLETFASQGALAIERTRLSKSETRALVLEESDRLKSSLLSSVSHELRSPLSAIKAAISSLRSGTVDWNSSARQDLLSMVEEETDHLNLLVGNLLDMSRIEAGALKPQKKWNSLAEIAIGVVTKMRKQVESYHLEMDFPPDLPLVPSDYLQMEQVFTNLISNSVKYAPEKTDIQIMARQEGRNQVHIQVTNQGPPVPEEHLDRIFDKFYRVTAAERITGTGLGLSICKGIIEAHGGKIWAENSACCFIFHFTLPLTLDGALPEPPKEAPLE